MNNFWVRGELRDLKDNEIRIYFFKPDNWEKKVYAYIYSEDGKEVKPWPGNEMKYSYANFCNENKEKGYYTLIVPLQSLYLHHVVFSDGKQQTPDIYKEGFPAITGYYNKDGLIGLQTTGKYGISLVINSKRRTIYYKPRDDWEKVYAHFHCTIFDVLRGDHSYWTCEKMYKTKNGNFVLYLPTGYHKVTVAFQDGNIDENQKRWDNNHGYNFEVDENNQNNFINHTI